MQVADDRPKIVSNISWFLVWNIIDLISTVMVLVNDTAIEGNPIPKLVADSILIFIVYKIVGSLLIAFILYKLNKTNWLIIPTYFLMVFSIWNILIAIEVIK